MVALWPAAGKVTETPAPLLQTSTDAGGAPPTTVALVGLVTWEHLPNVFTLDWRSQNPDSVWAANFEARACECLWLSAWQQLAPTAVPCKLPANITMPKSLVRGLGKFFLFVNDDTGAIISTAASYRSLAVRDTAAFASEAARTRFYGLNLEHCQSEACAEVANASWVDIYGIKTEGNLPVLWIRDGSSNVTVIGVSGGFTPFAFNYTFPPDFAQRVASTFRVDEGAADVTLGALIDIGYGAEDKPFWPPTPATCTWLHHYPYPGAFIDEYPFGTWPNATMWHCWDGEKVSSYYTHMVTIGDVGTAFTDRPIYLLK
jgi:hypothetical protein